jgi:glucosamine-6-phosphate deaminase
MDLVITRHADDVGAVAADIIAGAMLGRERFRLGVATGSSPMATYRHLSLRRERDLRDVKVEVFALDEYVGLPRGDQATYERTLQTTIGAELGLSAEAVHVPDAWAPDLDEACARYEALLRDEGGIDMQILGIGSNGHIAFNEPYSGFGSRTRLAALSEATRSANARFFSAPDAVPTHCLTQGIATILDAKNLLVVVDGTEKARALAQALDGPITWSCPASSVQLHPNVTVVADRAAASQLTEILGTARVHP